MSQVDQAAGLRRWAETQAPPRQAATTGSPSRVLVTLGLPRGAEADVTPVGEALMRWHEQGQRWVGDPATWRIVALSVNSPHFSTLASQQTRWALWVGDDPDGFRRGYAILKRMVQQGGPRRLLLVHPTLPSRAGLLDNLQQAAALFLGVQLLVIAPPKSRRACP
ncbi:hypothetical protein SAMN02745148_02968 [Modicisalibacter ilicicola DSM 19980]|uniref:Uncharacterized protein n=1 Tax=Modicisalibacter ilicicola DSM 19980 TaxID=1121942 RepID=A0A1M5CLJ1_9GAMM|nr:hypothetical protein [Halomonas ilicicola]SHF55571.1 hypothetical protein SAMN02745148_02968 [Halomonas ilicicola DSM 19980]